VPEKPPANPGATIPVEEATQTVDVGVCPDVEVIAALRVV
jgi:hypothetical protein